METQFEDPIDERDDGDEDCLTCGGSGWELVCFDDLCHGQGWCMHGDGEIPCRECCAPKQARP